MMALHYIVQCKVCMDPLFYESMISLLTLSIPGMIATTNLVGPPRPCMVAKLAIQILVDTMTI